MTARAVPSFDLLPDSTPMRRWSHRGSWRALLLALGFGLILGLLIVAVSQLRLQDERDALTSMQLDLERLQARQRELGPQLQVQQNLREQQQIHAMQRSRWQGAREVLVRLAGAPTRSARLQLQELKLDERGLMLTGHIPSGQFQPWMSALQLKWGPAHLHELSQPPVAEQVQEGQLERTRFILRFAAPAAGLGGQP